MSVLSLIFHLVPLLTPGTLCPCEDPSRVGAAAHIPPGTGIPAASLMSGEGSEATLAQPMGLLPPGTAPTHSDPGSSWGASTAYPKHSQMTHRFRGSFTVLGSWRKSPFESVPTRYAHPPKEPGSARQGLMSPPLPYPHTSAC